ACRDGEIKLLEFNADTPTGLLEASVVQWYWLQEFNKSYDQFNSIHEKMVAHMRWCKEYFPGGLMHLCSVKDSTEDYMTVKYMEDCAQQAGIETEFLYVDEISLDEEGRFCTPPGMPIHSIFKLYPWEWMFGEEFGEDLLSPINREMNWIEPPYKVLLSNKMILVLLHELFPHSPYILPAKYNTTFTNTYVQKPVFSREGANITIVERGQVLEQTEGDYGEEGYIYQQYFELPHFNGNTPVIGSWLIGGVPAGIGIRESSGLITKNTSRFIPHFFT
ncbi:MAG: glutathionylspermidine synthase family protein, partial [Flavisolibacter sp.]|nr:glutathionylspermidine synthase family protein [Flavisolibacter sp.]